MKRLVPAIGAALAVATACAFEKIAYIDSFDYPAVHES